MMGSSFRHQRRNIDDRMALDAHDAPIGFELFETLLQARLLDLVQMVCHDALKIAPRQSLLSFTKEPLLFKYR